MFPCYFQILAVKVGIFVNRHTRVILFKTGMEFFKVDIGYFVATVEENFSFIFDY